jgi:hypothetical protein
MRVDARARSRLDVAPALVAIALVPALAFAGCRTAGAAGPASLDPSLQAALTSAEQADTAALPDDPAKTLVVGRCLLCHGTALITQQRKDAVAWGRTVTQMRSWGTPLRDDEQATLVTYLAEHFGALAHR